MTRISSAQRGLNAFIDQIVNARNDASALAGSPAGGQAVGFESHFAKLGSDEGTKAQSGDTSSATAEGTVERQKDPANAMSALFAALTGDEGSPAVAQGGDTEGQIANTLPGNDSTNAASALFAALNGNGQGADTEAPNSAPLNQSPISNLLSFANMAASTSDSGSKSADTTQDASLSLSQPQPTSQKPAVSAASASSTVKRPAGSLKQASPASNAATDLAASAQTTLAALAAPLTLQNAAVTQPVSKDASASSTVKRPAGSLKQASPTSNTAADLAASAQMTLAALAASLTPQNPAVTQPVRKDAASSSSASTSVSARGQVSAEPVSEELSSSVLPSNDTQSQSDAVELSLQSTSLDALGDAPQSTRSSEQAVKMTVSSVQAETHFAPIQQLSPTQQIADFIALTAGGAPIADTAAASADTVAPSIPDAAAAATPSLAASSVATSSVKMLTLALEPDALGTVTVTMRLVNSNLELTVAAEKSDTASLIEKDKDNLSDKLQSLGYAVDSMVVKTALPQNAHLDPSNDQALPGQGQQTGNDASAPGSSQNGGRNGNDQSPNQTSPQTGDGLNQDLAAVPASGRTLSDGVYL